MSDEDLQKIEWKGKKDIVPGFLDQAFHHLMIAGAGAGKTTFLVKRALNLSGYTLITTFTNRNTEEIKAKIRKLNSGCIPQNIEVMQWDTFLLHHGARPFRRCATERKITGMLPVQGQTEGAPRWIKSNQINYYMTPEGRIYSDKLANFVCRCDNCSNGAVINRLSRCYSRIYIDEVQDLIGYDLEFLNKLLHQNICEIVMAGDPRQTTFHTHWEIKNRTYNNGRIDLYVNDQCKDTDCSIDFYTLNHSFRCRPEICAFSSILYQNFPPVETKTIYDPTGHDGVFLIKDANINKYLKQFRPVQLRESRRTNVNLEYPVMNMGESKGATFDRVLIYPTEEMLKWTADHNIKLKDQTKAKFYVAITRARYSVGIVCKTDRIYQMDIEGVKRY